VEDLLPLSKVQFTFHAPNVEMLPYGDVNGVEPWETNILASNARFRVLD